MLIFITIYNLVMELYVGRSKLAVFARDCVDHQRLLILPPTMWLLIVASSVQIVPAMKM